MKCRCGRRRLDVSLSLSLCPRLTPRSFPLLAVCLHKPRSSASGRVHTRAFVCSYFFFSSPSLARSLFVTMLPTVSKNSSIVGVTDSPRFSQGRSSQEAALLTTCLFVWLVWLVCFGVMMMMMMSPRGVLCWESSLCSLQNQK